MAGTAETKNLEVKDSQRRRATHELLLKKRPVEKTVTLGVTGDDGEVQEVELLFRSIGSKAYDELVAKHPPTALQRREDLSYNMDTFAPALIARCCVDPEMTVEEVKELWTSDQWNRGELLMLFMAAVEVNTRGLDIPFTGSD